MSDDRANRAFRAWTDPVGLEPDGTVSVDDGEHAVWEEVRDDEVHLELRADIDPVTHMIDGGMSGLYIRETGQRIADVLHVDITRDTDVWVTHVDIQMTAFTIVNMSHVVDTELAQVALGRGALPEGGDGEKEGR